MYVLPKLREVEAANGRQALKRKCCNEGGKPTDHLGHKMVPSDEKWVCCLLSMDKSSPIWSVWEYFQAYDGYKLLYGEVDSNGTIENVYQRIYVIKNIRRSDPTPRDLHNF